MRPMPLFVVLCCLVFFSAAPACAAVDFSIGGGYLYGSTQYQIGGHYIDADGTSDDLHFPISELRFPLDTYVIKGQVDLSLFEKWGVIFNLETNPADGTGQMEDSDWGVWDGSAANSLDIYSESNSDLSMLAFEGKLTYQIYQGYYGQNTLSAEKANPGIIFTYHVGLGYKYQKFDFDIYDVEESYPSTPAVPDSYTDGLAMIYEAEFQIPYLELGMEMALRDKFALGLNVAYAPYIAFQDKDQHLLRSKVNTSDHGWDGDALMVHLDMRYSFYRNWYLQADIDATKIESNGKSKSYLFGVYDHTIDHEVFSHQFNTYLMLGYSF